MKALFSHLSSSLLTLLYPPRCPLCDTWNAVPYKSCHRCSLHLHVLKASFTPKSHARIWFREAKSTVAYEGSIVSAIWGLKYHERFDLLPFFTRLLESSVSQESYDVILPVPLHRKKLLKRGFNQAAMLATSLSAVIDIPTDLFLLERTRETETQVSKDVKEREENVREAFTIRVSKKKKLFQKKILLIDDVMTTGATTNECAKVLVKAGALHVDVLTIARPL